MAVALRTLVYVTGFILLWGWVALECRRLDARIGIEIPAWLQMLGMPLVIGGGLLAFSCIGVFVKAGKGTPAPFDPPREFVAGGPYRYVRNPMYIGGLGLLTGLGLYLSSVSILLLTTLLFLGVHLFVILYEERTLEKKFGASYRRYKTSVNRWVPRFPL